MIKGVRWWKVGLCLAEFEGIRLFNSAGSDTLIPNSINLMDVEEMIETCRSLKEFHVYT